MKLLETTLAECRYHDIDVENPRGRTPLHDAARGGSAGIIRLLLDYGADIEYPSGDDGYRPVILTDARPLHFAAENKDSAVLQFLLDQGAEVHSRTNSGETPLHWAANSRTTHRESYRLTSAERVAILLDHGADVNARDLSGNTPLHEAARWSSAQTVTLLLDRGADIHAESEEGTALHQAATRGDPEIVALLLDRGLDIEARNIYGQTPIFSAAQSYYGLEAVRLLLDRGANGRLKAIPQDAERWEDWPPHVGWTPLHAAVETKNTEMVLLLLEHGADVNAAADVVVGTRNQVTYDQSGKVISVGGQYKIANNVTPLDFALGFSASNRQGQQSLEMTRLLLERGADVEAAMGHNCRIYAQIKAARNSDRFRKHC